MALRAVSQSSSSGGGAVDSVNGQTGVVVLDIDDIGGVFVDGVTITGDGTSGDPLVATSGSGTVQTVSIVSANGFAGTSDGDPTDPALTLSTTVTGILQGNGTAISAASTTGSGNVVLATSPVLTTPNIGNATGNISGNAGTVTFVDAGGDTTTFVALGTSATGSLSPATDAGLTYNATTNILTSGGFSGDLTGNVTGNVNGVTLTNAGSSSNYLGEDGTYHAVPAGGGTVETISIASANGFAGSSDGDPTDPELTISTTITGILQGNGTAISAASTTGSGNVVLATSPTLVTPNIGSATGSVSGNAGTATALQNARTIGGVSFDGTANIVPQTIQIVDAGGDTTTFPMLATSATGSLQPTTDADLSYNATTNALTASTFIGALTGNSSTATALQTPRTIGGVSFDGTANIVPQTIQVADAGGDTTTFPLLAGAASGDLQPLTDAGLSYNSTTNALTASTFVGALTGNADTATTATNANNINLANEATDTTCFVVFSTTATGNQAPKTNTGLAYNSNTNNLTVTTFTGALSGNSTTATALQNARTIGGVSFDGTANIVPQTIESANEATDTTCFPLFITASGTQSLQPKNNANLTFNSNTGALGSTSVTVGNTGLTVGASVPFSDSAGTLTLQNVDALDATTESTIEAAIDTLANLTNIQGNTFTLAGNFITSGANSLTLTTTGTTNVTLPTTGTLATLAGTETLSGKTLTAPKFANGGFIADANGNELIIFTTTASAVNEITFANGATGVGPTFTASGETNVDINFQTKGTGVYNFLATASGPTDIRLFEDTDNGTNYISIIAPATVASNKVATLQDVTGTIYVTGGTDVAIADGGTGASTAATAFSNLKQAATTTATGVVEKATQAEMEAETADKYPSAAEIKYSPGVAKCMVLYDQTGTLTIRSDVGVSGVSDDGVGLSTITFDTAFSSADYYPAGWGRTASGGANNAINVGGQTGQANQSTTACPIATWTSGTLADSDYVSVVFFGDQ